MIFSKVGRNYHGLGFGKLISPKCWMQVLYHLITEDQVGLGLVNGHRVSDLYQGHI